MSFLERYGPWALIAGASEGTGAAFAKALAEQGLNLILVARRIEPLEALAAEISASYSVKSEIATIDLTGDDAFTGIVAAAGDHDIGLYINNVGGDPNSSTFLDENLENWERLVWLDVMSVMRNCHFFGNKMRRQRRGGIIIVGSGACYGGLSGKAVYSGVKAFDLCFGEALWAELRDYGVDVLNLILGQTDTPAYRRVLAECGLEMPNNVASADAVARLGLARLPHGPVCNWGSNDDEAGMAPTSPNQRRDRILAIEKASRAFTKKA